MKQLAIHHAMAEGKLYEILAASDTVEAKAEYNQAIAKLYHKGLIDMVKNPENTTHIVRMKVVYQ